MKERDTERGIESEGERDRDIDRYTETERKRD